MAIYEAAGEAVSRARRGDGPTLIEIKTDRLLGHFQGDAQVYRSPEEFERMNDRDAIRTFEARLVSAGGITDDEIAEIWTACRAEVDAAIEFARTSPYPAPEAALDHVFA